MNRRSATLLSLGALLASSCEKPPVGAQLTAAHQGRIAVLHIAAPDVRAAPTAADIARRQLARTHDLLEEFARGRHLSADT